MNKWKRIALTLASAALITLSIHPFAFWPLALVAWIPFFFAIQDTTFRVGFRLGILHAFATFAGTLSWLFTIFGTLAPALWFILALFTGIFGGLATLPRFKNSPALLALIWTGLEYFRSEHFILSFPWITPGTAFPPNLFTPIIGVFGLTFLIILSSLFISQKRFNWGLGLIIALIAASVSSPVDPDQDNSHTVALVQNETMNFDDYRNPSIPLKDEVDFIVWPEYALSFDPTHERNAYALDDISALLDSRAQLLVTGGQTWHDPDNEIWSNTAFTFGKTGILGTHFKNHTVHFFNDGEKGTTANAVDTPIGKIGTPVCFDCDHQDVIRKMTADGAELFLIPSMDAAHWTKRQHLQHGQLFRHRAAENGRWLAIASTSGLTQIVDPNGHTSAQLPLMEEGVLTGQISPRQHRTLFQRGGWLFGPATLLGTFALIIRAIIDAFQKRRTLPA
ncbi:MAG: apolipoprotein N-acyltransferase [Verrucomicrobiaceae bacterium]